MESTEFIVRAMSLDAGPRRVSADGKERRFGLGWGHPGRGNVAVFSAF